MANMTETDALRYSKFTTDENLMLDDFILYKDIDKIHSGMIDRYYVLKNKTFTTTAEKLEMTQLLIDLEEYMVTSDAFNKLCACIKTMQMFMRDGIVIFVDEKKAELIELMQSYKSVGEWNSITSYKAGNVVVHSGFSFLSKVENNLNNEPNNESVEDDYWLKLTIKGDKGDPSLNINYKGEYSPTTTYNLGDTCTYNGIMYYVKMDGVIGVLPTDQTKWAYVDKVIVSNIQPTDTHVVWWDTSTNNNCFKRYTTNLLWETLNIDAKDVIVGNTNLENVLNNISPNQITNGTFSGIVKASTNTNYNISQLRNVILSPNDADINIMNNGDIWIKYE